MYTYIDKKNKYKIPKIPSNIFKYFNNVKFVKINHVKLVKRGILLMPSSDQLFNYSCRNL